MTLQPPSTLEQLLEANAAPGTDRYCVFFLKRAVLGNLASEQDRPLSYCISPLILSFEGPVFLAVEWKGSKKAVG